VGESYTRTARTSERSGGNAQAPNHHHTFTYYSKLSKGPKSAKNRPYPTNSLIAQSSNRWKGPTGRVHFASLSLGDRATRKIMTDKLKLQVPDTFLPVGASGTLPDGAYSGQKMYLLSMEMQTIFTNFSQAGCFIHLYEIHVKKSTNDVPPFIALEGLRQTQGHETITAAEAAAGDGPIGTNLNDSELFKEFFAVDYQEIIFLGPGDVHSHHSLHAPHKTISAFDSEGSLFGTHETYDPTATRFLVWGQWGKPALLPGSAFAVSTANTDVGFTCNRKYKYSMTELSVGDIDTTGALLATGGVGLIREEDGDEVVMDDLGP